MHETYLFRVLVVPSAVFLSVIFGASYGSGREVVEFISANGPTGGLISIVTVGLSYGVLLALSFEIARMFKAFDYVSFFGVLLGRAWFLYEMVIMVGMVIALSITTTIGGTVLEEHFGVPVWTGMLMVFVLVIVLTCFGRAIVQQSMMFSVVALFAVLTVLVIQLINGHADTIVTSFETHDYQKGGWVTGAQYAIANGGYLPLLLYCAGSLRSRSEAFAAGAVAAGIAVLPATIFHVAFMSGYPGVIQERLPTYWMFGQVSTPLLLSIYVGIMFVLIAQTGVGLLQGLIERLDVWQQRRRGRGLTRLGNGLVSGGMIGISMLLGSMGIIALILRGYTLMSISFIVVFVVPLLTRGVYVIFAKRR